MAEGTFLSVKGPGENFNISTVGFYGVGKSNFAIMPSIKGKLDQYERLLKHSPCSRRKTEQEVNKFSKKCDRTSTADFESLLTEIIQLHKSYRPDKFHSYYSKCTNHLYVYRALRICFYYGEEIDSRLVKKLICEIYFCDGDLQAIFGILTANEPFPHGTSAQHKYLFQFSHQDGANSDAILSFYIDNIPRKIRILRKRSNQPETRDLLNVACDVHSNLTPLMIATMKRNTSAVLLFLRYGANPFITCGGEGDNLKDAVEYIVSYLNSILYFRTVTSSEHVLDQLCIEQNKALECFSYFLRAVKNIPLKTTNNVFDPHESRTAYYASPNLALLLDMDRFRSPPNLQHLCRFEIRKHFMKDLDAKLPRAISSLPIPAILKQYLDLKR